MNKRNPRRPWQLPYKTVGQGRLLANRDVYDSMRWRIDSAAHRKENPLCEQCYRSGIFRPSNVSDHIVPINHGGDIWDWGNRQALCYGCHAKKSGRESKWGRGV